MQSSQQTRYGQWDSATADQRYLTDGHVLLSFSQLLAFVVLHRSDHLGLVVGEIHVGLVGMWPARVVSHVLDLSAACTCFRRSDRRYVSASGRP